MKRFFDTVMREIRALWRLTMRTLANTITASPSERWQRAMCMHHQTKQGDQAAPVSHIKSQLIDLGRNKMWWCSKCNTMWFISELTK